MNPDEKLEEVRKTAEAVRKGQADGQELARKVVELDGWLSAGGPPPSQWRTGPVSDDP